MDLTRDVTYRGFLLNDEDVQTNVVPGGGIAAGITGCVLDSFDLSDADVVQFTEKRSQQDGNDAGDPYLGMRRVNLTGTLYGVTRALLYDALWDLRAAMSPVLAHREELADRGYRPLYFTVPTNRIEDYGTGEIALMVKAMPRKFSCSIGRDNQGGEENDSLAITWSATMVCKDPSIMGAASVDTNFTVQSEKTGATISEATNLVTKASHGLSASDRVRFTSLTGGTGLSTTTNYWVLAAGLTSSVFAVSTTDGGAAVDVLTNYSDAAFVKSFVQSGNVSNRGTYISPLDMLIVVSDASGSISGTIGDSTFSIAIPASTGSRTLRFKGEDKVFTVEEGAVEVPAMDWLTFSNDTTWPLIPSGTSAYSFTVHGAVVDTGSHFWFYEQYA